MAIKKNQNGRLSYARIEVQKHPLATGKNVQMSLSNRLNVPQKEDLEIAEEILKIHEDIKKLSGADGEWKWINENKRGEYMEALNSSNVERLAAVMCNMFRNEAAYGVVSGNFEDLKKPAGRLD